MPIPIHSGAADSKRDGASVPRKRSVFGRLWRGTRWVASGPFEAFPGAAIARNGRFIGRLWRLVRVGPQSDARLYLQEDRSIDLTATAFAYGISIGELEARLVRRRRETARAAYLSFGFGWVFFGLWVLRAATMPWTSVHVFPLLEFMPFCAIFLSAGVQERAAELPGPDAHAGDGRAIPGDFGAVLAELNKVPTSFSGPLRHPGRRDRGRARRSGSCRA